MIHFSNVHRYCCLVMILAGLISSANGDTVWDKLKEAQENVFQDEVKKVKERLDDIEDKLIPDDLQKVKEKFESFGEKIVPDEFPDWLNNQGLMQPIIFTKAAEDLGVQSLNHRLNKGTHHAGDGDQSLCSTQFSIFNRLYPEGQTISLKDDATDFRSKIDVGYPFKIIIHGWLSSAVSRGIEGIKDAYADVGSRLNLITVNWQVLAKKRNYRVSAKDTYTVGIKVSKLIIRILQDGLAELCDFHLIGHSLGAHIAGTAAALSNTGGKKIRRISALDAAAPGFEIWKSWFLDQGNVTVLSKDHADFVDVIHTTAYLLGFASPLGHVDFFANGGLHPQPGCPIGQVVCSHARAHVYFAESIREGFRDGIEPEWEGRAFLGKECSKKLDYFSGKCDANKMAIMGEDADASSLGSYYLLTNSKSPFALPIGIKEEIDCSLVANQVMKLVCKVDKWKDSLEEGKERAKISQITKTEV